MKGDHPFSIDEQLWEGSGCPHDVGDWALKVITNGAKYRGWWCYDCCGWAEKDGKRWHTTTGWDLDVLTVAETADPVECGHCGAVTFCEWHHYGPKEQFGEADAERWPQGWLCLDCHAGWHDGMGHPIRKPAA